MKNKRVKLTKLSGDDKSSLPVGYWVDGYIVDGVVLGQRLWLEPINDDSFHSRFDYFRTTEVQSFTIENPRITIMKTQNSTWEVQFL